MANKKKKSIFESTGWKTGMKYLYGLGAAIVIIGALFKILHLPGADIALIVGLTTEAVIFFFSAFEPLPHEDTHWEWNKVYPQLLAEDDDEESMELTAGNSFGSGLNIPAPKLSPEDLKKISSLTPTMFEDLSTAVSSLRGSVGELNNGVESMGSISDAMGNTKQFAEKLKVASTNVEQLANGYSTSAETMKQFNSALGKVKENQEMIQKETAAYQAQVQAVTKNLSSLNAIYEIELQDAQKHINQITKFYGTISQVMQNLINTSTDTDALRSEVSVLAKNMRTLNTVYGNMLTAMASGAKA